MSIPAHLVEIARAADILAIARRHAALKRIAPAEWAGPCPRCGGTDRFSVNTRKSGGIFNCRGCGVKGNVIALVMHADGCSFKQAVERLSGEPVTEARPRPPAVAEMHSDPGAIKRAAAVWDEALPIAGTDGEAYLARRGIGLDDVPNYGGLRWHPRCPWETGTTPCVVARYTHATTVEPRGIWRRPITGGKPKGLGPNAGCVIRLWPDDAVERGLVLGEGVETTLAAATRIVHLGTYLRPAWAAGSASNMAAFPALAGVESLTLLVDHDPNGAGQFAASQCACRWEEAGKEAIRLTPGECGVDFNDLVERHDRA